MKKVLGYIRVSHASQTENRISLERQSQQIKSYCRFKNLPEPIIIADEGISGYKSNRPGYIEVMDLCKNGEVRTLVIYDLSRLSRSVRGTLEFIEDIVVKNKISFVCLKQDINTSTATGKAFLSISAVFAQLYRDDISEKCRAALNHKKQNGEKLGGHIPYGFDVSGKFLIPNKVEQNVIQLILYYRECGYSFRQIARELAKKNLKTKTGSDIWSPSTLKKIIGREVSNHFTPDSSSVVHDQMMANRK